MISLTKTGLYELIETKRNTKVLYIDDEVFAWVEPMGIGEILVASRTAHKTDCVLSAGEYRLFRVKDEAGLSDHIHLELEVGLNRWQGYLLLSGFPSSKKKRVRIIPTNEVISDNPKFELKNAAK